MAILKIQNNAYNLDNIYAIMNDYVLYPKVYHQGKVIGRKPADYCGINNLYGCFVDRQTVEGISRQMDATAKAIGKDFGQCIRHFEIAFDSEGEDWQISPEMANGYAYRIATDFLHNYQSVYAVHTNTENLHIHFVINAVDLVTRCKPNITVLFRELSDYISRRRDFPFMITQIKTAAKYCPAVQ